MLLGPAQRQIEFGQSRRCELDRLPALQDGFESFVAPITAAIATLLVIAACGCRKSHPGWRRCRDGHPRFEMTDLLKSFFTLSKRKGLPRLSGSRPRDRRFHVERNLAARIRGARAQREDPKLVGFPIKLKQVAQLQREADGRDWPRLA